jgi:hypothetical protein
MYTLGIVRLTVLQGYVEKLEYKGSADRQGIDSVCCAAAS